MAIKNKTKYAILGILSISSGSGYDIKKYCDSVIANVWHENFGHIYPVLNNMLAEGLIKRKNEDETTRKKEYEITELGKDEFLSWIAEPTQYTPARSEFMLKLLFSNHVSEENRRKMIEDYKTYHLLKYEKFKKMEEDLIQPIPGITSERKVYLNATIRYGILSTEAALTRCDEVITAISR